MKKLFVILLIIAAAIVVLPIAYRNSVVIDFDYFFDVYTMPLSWLIFGAFVLGVLFALVFFAITGLGWKLKARSLKKQVDELLKQRKRDEIAEQFETEKALEKQA